MGQNQHHLLGTQRFLPLFITQFCNAFNDNIFKNALVILITYKITQNVQQEQFLIALAGGIFILPFLLFSATAGQLADKHEKSFLIRLVKFFEIVFMAVGGIGFYYSNLPLLMTTLFCLGLHSTLFGPIKYAILPEKLHANELLGGNALIEAGTFIAILIGQIMGGSLILGEQGILWVTTALLSIALFGFAISFFIPQTRRAAPNLKISWNIFRETWHLIKITRQQKTIFLAIIGISWFWFIGATFLTQLPTFTKETLHANASIFTLFLTIFSIGIGVGSLLCNFLLKGQVTAKYVPLALLTMSLFMLDIYFTTRHLPKTSLSLLSLPDFLSSWINIRILMAVFLMTVSSGLFIVPLYSLIQKDAEPATRSRIIGCNNIINSLFMVASSVTIFGMVALGLTIPDAFLILAIANLIFVFLLRKLSSNT